MSMSKASFAALSHHTPNFNQPGDSRSPSFRPFSFKAVAAVAE